MKKISAVIMGTLFSAAVLSGCSKSAPVSTETEVTSGQEAGADQTAAGSAAAKDEETTASEEPESKERPVIRMAGDDTGMPNPFKHQPRGPGMSKMQILYDTLLEKDENGDIPWLAREWQISDDGLTYTFQLTKDAKWHDGTALTADDVAFTFEYYKEHPPVVNDLLAGDTYLVASAAVLDPYTVEVKTERFDNTMLTKLGGVRILPKHIWENVADPMAFDGEGAVIASGPYIMEVYDSAQGLYRYVANPDYWGPKPALSAIEWVPVGDQILAFENGEIDLMNAPADMVSRYQSDSAFTVKTGTSYHSYRLMMNMETVPALQDMNLRQAMAYAIDVPQLVEKVARGQATVSSKGYIPDTSSWYHPDTPQYETDVEKARELLGGKTYAFTLLTDSSPASVGAGELIKISLAEIGIDITLESVESKTRDSAIRSGEYELLLNNLGGLGGDPDYLRGVFGGNATVKGWQNDVFLKMAADQAVEKNEDIRKEMISEMQMIIAEELPMIMLHSDMDNYVFRTDKYDGWMFRYDHNKVDHNKLSYVIR